MTTWAPEYEGVRVFGLRVEPRSWQPDGAMFIQRMPEEKDGELLMSHADHHTLRTEIALQTDLYNTGKHSARGTALIDRAGVLEREWQELGKPDVLADWAAGRRKTGKTEVIRAMAKRYKVLHGASVHIASMHGPAANYYRANDEWPDEGFSVTELPGLGRDVREYQVLEERYLSNVKASAHRLADMDDHAPRYELERAALHNADEAFYNARVKAEMVQAAVPEVAQTYAAGDVLHWTLPAEPAVPVAEEPAFTAAELDLQDRWGLTWRKYAKIINDAGAEIAEKRPYSIPQFAPETVDKEIDRIKAVHEAPPAERYQMWRKLLDQKWERMGTQIQDNMEKLLWAPPTEEDMNRTRLAMNKEDQLIGTWGRRIFDFIGPALVVAAWVIACITGAAAFFWLFPG